MFTLLVVIGVTKEYLVSTGLESVLESLDDLDEYRIRQGGNDNGDEA